MPRTYRPAKSIRVLLAEDPRTTRGALAVLLGMEPDLAVVAQVRAGDGVVDAVVDAVLTHRPDVALLDVELPGTSGPDVAAVLRDQAPDCRVLILATFGGPGQLRRALAAGAAGFVVKDGSVDELAAAIRRAITGETVIDPVFAAAALDGGPGPLTPRECEVLAAVSDGATVAGVAVALGLPEAVVRDHLASALSRTGTRTPMEAVREARHRGWL